MPKNAPADNFIEIEAERLPVSASALLIGMSNNGDNQGTYYNNDESDLNHIHLPLVDGYDKFQSSSIEVDKYIVGRTYSPSDWTGINILFKLNPSGIDDSEYGCKTWFIGAIRFAAYSASSPETSAIIALGSPVSRASFIPE